MNADDTPPCPDCGGQLTEHGPDDDSSRNAYDCPSCAWGLQDCDEPLTVADAPWTREVWAEVEAARTERDRLRCLESRAAWSLKAGDARYTAESLLRRVVAIAVSRETRLTPAWVRVKEATGLGAGFSRLLIDWADAEAPSETAAKETP